MKTEKFSYSQEKFPFQKIIKDYLLVENLEEISQHEDTVLDSENSLYKNMEQTPQYKKLYENLDGENGKKFYSTYDQFIKEVIRPQYKEPIFYQKKPTHRILFKDGKGVSRFHRDSDYGHNTSEINYFLPVTHAFKTNTIWIESEVGKEDFSAIELKPGEFARFKGVSLKHGAKINTTGKTRISFDFRVIPFSEKPEHFADTSSWEERDIKDNPLFKNAHNFSLCE